MVIQINSSPVIGEDKMAIKGKLAGRLQQAILLVFCCSIILFTIKARIEDSGEIQTTPVPETSDAIEDISHLIAEMLRRPCQYDLEKNMKDSDDIQLHPYLVNHLRTKVLKRTSFQPLHEDDVLWRSEVDDPSESEHMSRSAIPKFFQNFSGPGTFFEGGALNAYDCSNTYYMEKALGWTGLLAEMSPLNDPFENAKKHKRSVMTAGVCMSSQKTPCRATYSTSLAHKDYQKYFGAGFSVYLGGMDKDAALSEVKDATVRHELNSSSYEFIAPVECYPLTTLLMAANLTKLDFLALDVYGAEQFILSTVAWDQLDIKVMKVEVYRPVRSLTLMTHKEKLRYIFASLAHQGFEPHYNGPFRDTSEWKNSIFFTKGN